MEFASTLLAGLVETPALLFITVGLLGLIMGSFLNVVILRLPRIMEHEWRQECAALAAADATEAAPDSGAGADQGADQGADAPALSLSHPASHCPHCGHRIRPWENIPVLSWLLLRGRCSACAGAISWRYPAVEALTALLSLLVVWHFGPTSQAAAAALVFTWGLLALAFIDADTQLLPDDITLPLLWLGLVLSLGGVFVDSQAAILGAAAGYLSLWLVFHAFRLLTGKEGMGRGDFKLLALFGAWMGWQTLPQIVLLSAVPGAVLGIALVLSGRTERETPMPFGPFLAVSGWVNLLWGPDITAAYLRFSGLA
ncbi:prepilin peptidase [Thiohalocapsa halophila]|uniref:Prepilin leader peptidase/N-methyltransferase n=1 Tax=Thiohalocapsa halophila TaxID=69359 RepID=A0ABS1CGI7_9GAMM|nr:A24 family peptidase [Thiohalocapsa halophila]MBK1630823.1 prepilin peptidase [Thiohalocapsa halophila]